MSGNARARGGSRRGLRRTGSRVQQQEIRGYLARAAAAKDNDIDAFFQATAAIKRTFPTAEDALDAFAGWKNAGDSGNQFLADTAAETKDKDGDERGDNIGTDIEDASSDASAAEGEAARAPANGPGLHNGHNRQAVLAQDGQEQIAEAQQGQLNIETSDEGGDSDSEWSGAAAVDAAVALDDGAGGDGDDSDGGGGGGDNDDGGGEGGDDDSDGGGGGGDNDGGRGEGGGGDEDDDGENNNRAAAQSQQQQQQQGRQRRRLANWRERSEADLETEFKHFCDKGRASLIRVPTRAQAQVQAACRPYLKCFHDEMEQQQPNQELLRKALVRLQTVLAMIVSKGDKGGKKDRRTRAVRGAAAHAVRAERGEEPMIDDRPPAQRAAERRARRAAETNAQSDEQARHVEAQKRHDERTARDAMTQFDAGNIHRAVAVVSRGGLHEANATAEEKTRKLHPQRADGTDVKMAEVYNDTFTGPDAHVSVVNIEQADLASVINRMCNGAAPGPSKTRPEHLRCLMKDNMCGKGLTAIVNFISNGGFLGDNGKWEGVADLLLAGRLVLLAKPNGGVRPIALTETLIKVAEKMMVERHAAEIDEDLMGHGVIRPPSRDMPQGHEGKLRQYVSAKGGSQLAILTGQGCVDNLVQNSRHGRLERMVNDAAGAQAVAGLMATQSETGSEDDNSSSGGHNSDKEDEIEVEVEAEIEGDNDDDSSVATTVALSEPQADLIAEAAWEELPGALSVDYANAFNSVSRLRIFERLAEPKLRGMLKMTMGLLGREPELSYTNLDGDTVTLTSSEGVRQGGPASPALFAMAMQPLLRAAVARQPNVRAVAFADDTTFYGPLGQLREVWTYLLENIESQTGCTINTQKTKIVMLDGAGATDGMRNATAEGVAAHFDVDLSCVKHKAFKTLGAVIGVEDEMTGEDEYVELPHFKDEVVAVWEATRQKMRKVLQTMRRLPAPFTLQTYMVLSRESVAMMAGYALRNTPTRLASGEAGRWDADLREELEGRLGTAAVGDEYKRLFQTDRKISMPLKLGGLGYRKLEPLAGAANLSRIADSSAALEQTKALLDYLPEKRGYGSIVTLDNIMRSMEHIDSWPLWLNQSTGAKLHAASERYEADRSSALQSLEDIKKEESKAFQQMEKEKRKKSKTKDAGASKNDTKVKVYKFQAVYTARQDQKGLEDLVFAQGGGVFRGYDGDVHAVGAPEWDKERVEDADSARGRKYQADNLYAEICEQLPVFKHNPLIVQNMLARTLSMVHRDSGLALKARPGNGTAASDAAILTTVMYRLGLPLSAFEACYETGRRTDGGVTADVMQDEHYLCTGCASNVWPGGIGRKPMAAFPDHALECPGLRKSGNGHIHGRVQRVTVQCLREAGSTARLMEDPGKAVVPTGARAEVHRQVEAEQRKQEIADAAKSNRAVRHRDLRKLEWSVMPDFTMENSVRVIWGDPTVVSPGCKSMSARVISMRRRGIKKPAATLREKEKLKKYEAAQTYFNGKHALGIMGREVKAVPVVMEMTGALSDGTEALLHSVPEMTMWSVPPPANWVQTTKTRMAVGLAEGMAGATIFMLWRMTHSRDLEDRGRRQGHFGRGGAGYIAWNDARRRLPAVHAGHR
jgi:reverse transcriptase-like protein